MEGGQPKFDSLPQGSDEETVLSLIYFGVKYLALMKYFGCSLVVFNGIEVRFIMALVQRCSCFLFSGRL